MIYDPGALKAALAAAVGDDPALVAELRAAFLESAQRQALALAAACTPATWRNAAWRLKGLAGSFGALDLMGIADEAADAAPGDPLILRKIAIAMGSFDEQG